MLSGISNNSLHVSFGRSTLGGAQRSEMKSLRQLSSGFRINQAADDAAGLAISERLSAATRSLDMATRNTSDGMSMIRVADGAMASQGDSLVRMRELATQAANGALNDSDREALHTEFIALRDEINRTGNTANFNGKNLLDGSSASIQVGISGGGAADSIDINGIDMRSASMGIDTLDISSQGGAQSAMSAIDTAIEGVSNARTDLGATSARLEAAGSNSQTMSVNTQASLSRQRDTDVAAAASDRTQSYIQMQFGIAAQSQANQSRGMLINTLL